VMAAQRDLVDVVHTLKQVHAGARIHGPATGQGHEFRHAAAGCPPAAKSPGGAAMKLGMRLWGQQPFWVRCQGMHAEGSDTTPGCRHDSPAAWPSDRPSAAPGGSMPDRLADSLEKGVDIFASALRPKPTLDNPVHCKPLRTLAYAGQADPAAR
jgi:hypothetical protein